MKLNNFHQFLLWGLGSSLEMKLENESYKKNWKKNEYHFLLTLDISRTNRRPDIVVNSPGSPMITRDPTRKICVSTMLGCQGTG